MFFLIEKESQLQNLPHFDKCFVQVITNNDNYHPAISDVSLIYVKPFEDKGYMLCIKHSESLSLKWQTVRKFLTEKELYAVDAKFTKYFFGGRIHDLTLNRGLGKFDFEKIRPNIISDFNSKFNILRNVNELIPICKHYEYCENIYEIVKKYLKPNLEFNLKLTEVFFKIEREGIKLDKDCFLRYHGDHSTPQFSIKRGLIYSQYNLYTLTGRPSNAYNGINYAALNRENGERTCYLPKITTFVDVDFSAYHPRLLCALTGFELPEGADIYKEISKILGEKDIIKVKEITFQNIYGFIQPELKEKPFFKEIQYFTDALWRVIQHDGKIETPSGKVFRLKDIENPTPQKLLNYFIQNYETSENVFQLHSVFNDFRPLKSRIVLYTYDSVLIDTDPEEIDKIKQIITKLKYPVKMKMGLNYNELR